ncbi:MAG: tRNA (adenosine(37)-N6)-dimethylallyltransferase MiaA [Candidatus Izemoplasmatales bacterium]
MNTIIVIVGPTAVGKTALSIELAKQLNTDIISADSMQFYKGFDIGTAKVKEDEKQGIVHHLIDILNPDEEFNVSSYQKVVRDQIDFELSKNRDVILVGGSGLYLQAVIYDYLFHGEKRDQPFEESYDELSNQELYLLLEMKNPTLASTVHPNNRRRLLRSLQIASDVNSSLTEQGKKLYYPHVYIVGLNIPRELLYERINSRVDQMVAQGLFEEVKKFYLQGIKGQSVQAIGYKEIYEYYQGNVGYEETIENIKQASRRYAKRQLTWFKNKMDAHWFDPSQMSIEEIAIEMINNIKNRAKS